MGGGWWGSQLSRSSGCCLAALKSTGGPMALAHAHAGSPGVGVGGGSTCKGGESPTKRGPEGGMASRGMWLPWVGAVTPASGRAAQALLPLHSSLSMTDALLVTWLTDLSPSPSSQDEGDGLGGSYLGVLLGAVLFFKIICAKTGGGGTPL